LSVGRAQTAQAWCHSGLFGLSHEATELCR
jgi:hypothetical protein